MSLILIFMGWFILNSLWGFLPIIEPLRLIALSKPLNRKILALASALLAFISGSLSIIWMSSYSTMVMLAHDAHSAAESGFVQASSTIFLATTQHFLYQLLPGIRCLSADASVCAMADQALQFSRFGSMLIVIGLAALIPALTASLVCWKFIPVSQTDISS